MDEDFFFLVADAIKEQFPEIYGFVQRDKNGFVITHGEQQFVVEVRPRTEEESFTLFELGG